MDGASFTPIEARGREERLAGIRLNGRCAKRSITGATMRPLSGLSSSLPRSARRQRPKAARRLTDYGLPVLSFQSLLGEPPTFTRNAMALAATPSDTFRVYPQSTTLQTRAFELLHVAPRL